MDQEVEADLVAGVLAVLVEAASADSVVQVEDLLVEVTSVVLVVEIPAEAGLREVGSKISDSLSNLTLNPVLFHREGKEYVHTEK